MLRHDACLRDEKYKITEREIPNQPAWRNSSQFTTLTQSARWPWSLTPLIFLQLIIT